MWIQRLALRVAVAFALILFVLRSYLFGNGLYVYRDWSWPLSTQVTPSAVYNPSVLANSQPNLFGFTRMFITWPLVLIDRITNNTILAEKAFIVYILVLIISLFFILAEVLLRTVEKFSGSVLSKFRAELFSVVIVLLALTNPWTLQYLSGLYFTYIIEMILFTISILLIILDESRFRSVILSGALVSLCILLDPDLFAYGLMAISISIIVVSLSKHLSLTAIYESIGKIVLLVAISLPSLLLVIYGLIVTSGTSIRPVNSFLMFSSNLSFVNALRLLGYWWSMIAYASPSVLGSTTSVASLPVAGSPPYVILSAGMLGTLWLASTWCFPILAFISLLFFRKFKIITITALAMLILGFVLTQPRAIPYPYTIVNDLSSVPVIGNALITVFADPTHILLIIASAYIMMIGISLYKLLSLPGPNTYTIRTRFSLSNKKTWFRLTRRLFPMLIIIMIILATFSGWQFFSGALYPSGYVGLSVDGNGIPSSGSFSPATPPNSMISTYNWLQSQAGNFNVYWPGPSGGTYAWSNKSTPSMTLIDSPKPSFSTVSVVSTEGFPAALEYLISSNLTGDISSYLAALNIKYIVTQPLVSSYMIADWGVSSIQTLTDVLQNSQGIQLVYSNGDVSVYGVENTWGQIYAPNLVLSYNGSDPRYSIGYHVFSSLNILPAFVQQSTIQNELCIDQLQCPFSILSPAFLSNQSQAAELNVLNNETPNFPRTILPPQFGRLWLGVPSQSWLVNNWGPGNVSAEISDAMMNWTFDNSPSYLTLSYECTGTDGHSCGISVPLDYQAHVQVSLSYRTSSNFNSSVRVAVSALNSTLKNIQYPISTAYGASQLWRTIDFNVTLSEGTSFFTPLIQTLASSGWIEITNVTTHVQFFKIDQLSPFGSVLTGVSNLSQSLGEYSGTIYVLSQGNGTISYGNEIKNVDSPLALSWQVFSSQSLADLKISGGVAVAAVLVTTSLLPLQTENTITTLGDGNTFITNSTGDIVYARYFVPGYSVTPSNRSSITLDGLNIFFGVASGKHSVSFAPLGVIQVSYIGIIGLNVVILTFYLLKEKQKAVKSSVRL